MTDTAQIAEQLHREARIRSVGIDDLPEIARLIAILNSAYAVDTSGNAKNENLKIRAEFFEDKFKNTGPSYYFADPFLARRTPETPIEILTQTDVISILESIAEEIEEGRLGDKEDHLDETQKKLLRDIAGGLIPRKEFLETDLSIMASALEALKAPEAPEKEDEDDEDLGEAEIFNGIPQELKTRIAQPLDLKDSWKLVERVITDAYTTKLRSERIITVISKKKYSLEVDTIRVFLNDWITKLYAQSVQLRFQAIKFELPAIEYFRTTKTNSADIDIPYWNQQDYSTALVLFAQIRTKVRQLLEYEEEHKPQTTETLVLETTESGEGEASVLKEEKPSEDQLESLLEKFNGANTSYSLEAARITTILLPQFFNHHGLQGSSNEFEAFNPALYGEISREFSLELENVLRTLSSKDFELLKNGNQTGFRLLVIRKLYPRLSTNPRFIGTIQLYKDLSVDQLPPTQAKVLTTKFNRSDEKFGEDLEAFEKTVTGKEDWTTDIGSTTPINIVDLVGTSSLTQADVKKILDYLSKNSFSSAQYDGLFRNLDVLLAEHWSPDELQYLDARVLETVLGIRLPPELLNDPKFIQRFGQVCSLALYSRRENLRNHYEYDILARGQKKVLSTGNLTAEEIAQLKEKQDLAEQFKDRGGAETILLAQVSTASSIQDLADRSYKHATTVSEAHQILQTKKKKELTTSNEALRQDLYSKKTLREVRVFLTDTLGADDLEVDEATDPEIQRAIAVSLAEKYLAEDALQKELLSQQLSYDEMSALALGGGVVENAAGPQRYGSEVGSLLKGGVNVKHLFQNLEKNKKNLSRVNTIRKAGQKVLTETLKTAGGVAAIPARLLDKKDLQTKAVVGLSLAGAANALGNFLNGGLITKVSTLIGGGAGAVMGGSLGFLVGGFPGAVTAGTLSGITGAVIGSNYGWNLEQALGGKGAVSINAPSGLASNILGTPAVNNATNPFALPTPAAVLTPSVVAGTATFTAIVVLPAVIGSPLANFLPPDFETVDPFGNQSKYLSITKTADPKTLENFTDPSQSSTITYKITVQPKGNYTIEITGFQDIFSTIKKPAEGQPQSNPPAPAGCEAVTFENLQTKTINSGESLVISTCTVTVNQQYNDTGIQNEVNLTFNASDETENVTNQTAKTMAITCVGKCPQFESGGWPTNGRITQGPFRKSGSHAIPGYADAVDIGADAGTPIYATFPGTAEFYNGLSQFDSLKGVYPTYGTQVVIKTNNGFALLFAHMLKFANDPSTGQPFAAGTKIPVQKCTLLGYVGSSGWSTGNHLHYEYRIISGTSGAGTIGTKQSVIGTILPDPFNRMDFDAAAQAVKNQVTTDCK